MNGDQPGGPGWRGVLLDVLAALPAVDLDALAAARRADLDVLAALPAVDLDALDASRRELLDALAAADDPDLWAEVDDDAETTP